MLNSAMGGGQLLHLDRRQSGLFIPLMGWGETDHFGPKAVCFVLASDFHAVDDRCKQYEGF